MSFFHPKFNFLLLLQKSVKNNINFFCTNNSIKTFPNFDILINKRSKSFIFCFARPTEASDVINAPDSSVVVMKATKFADNLPEN